MFLTFSNLWKLLRIFRSLAAGYDVQLLGDVTAKASTAALNRDKLGIGVNMLGKAPSRSGAGTVAQSAADIRRA